MDDGGIRMFMALAGQRTDQDIDQSPAALRELAAQLLLSETLEYVIKGLKVIPEVDGHKITDANSLAYRSISDTPDKLEMLDGLSDVAYTMFWNSATFGLNLEAAFERVCQNNLEKFISLKGWKGGTGAQSKDAWDLGAEIAWPAEVVTVEVLEVNGSFFAVGKDQSGKVRKPKSYRAVDLSDLL